MPEIFGSAVSGGLSTSSKRSLEVHAQRGARLAVEPNERPARDQVVDVTIELPLGIVKCHPWLVDAAVCGQPFADLTFSPRMRVARVVAPRRRGRSDDPRGDVGREEGAKLVERVSLAPHGADDDPNVRELAQQGLQAREKAEVRAILGQVPFALRMEDAIEVE